MGAHNIRGPWLAAFYYNTEPGLDVHLPRQVLLIEVQELKTTGVPTAADQATYRHVAEKVAIAVAHHLHADH